MQLVIKGKIFELPSDAECYIQQDTSTLHISGKLCDTKSWESWEFFCNYLKRIISEEELKAIGITISDTSLGLFFNGSVLPQGVILQ
jgi:hypothetical protein